MKYALAYAASEFVNFRQIEFHSLCEILHIHPRINISHCSQHYWSLPYIIVDLEDDESAVLLCHRSVLIKAVYHVWCYAPNLPDLMQKIRNLPDELTDQYLNSSCSYRLLVCSANKKLHHEEKLEIIESILNSHRRVTAPVKLQNPDNQLNVLLDYFPRNWGKGNQSRESYLRGVLYGRFLDISGRKHLMNSYRLKDRVYLGNTSMDVRLAGIMANAGLCKHGSLVWDPFLGTGSIVLAASAWGAVGGGSDIDYALLHGMGMSPKVGQGRRSDGECLHKNYAQYGLQSRYLDAMVADTAVLHRLFRIPGENLLHNRPLDRYGFGLFDAILTDPPYGFRESGRRVAGNPIEREPSLVTPERFSEITGHTLSNESSTIKSTQNLVAVPHDLPHFPHKEAYPLEEAYSDLLSLSARLLRPDGRLVYWFPIDRKKFSGPQSLPRHNRLELLAACEQTLHSRNCRVLVVMRKLNHEEDDTTDVVNPDRYFPAELVSQTFETGTYRNIRLRFSVDASQLLYAIQLSKHSGIKS